MKHDRRLHQSIERTKAKRPAQGSANADNGTSGRPKREMTVQQALEWAFMVEKAQLELPPRPDSEVQEAQDYGLEYIMIRQAQLGTKVDGGRFKRDSYTHEDAEVIAATLLMLPDALGGKRMAIRIAELARAGITPDWMPGVVPQCLPRETRKNQHGERAVTEVVGVERVLSRGKWRTVEVLVCPVIWHPHPEQIDAARRGYQDWVTALGWVSEVLRGSALFREVVVVAGMPKDVPWQ